MRTGKPKPTLGYASRTEAVAGLRAKGHRDAEIAEMIGISLKNVTDLGYARPGKIPSKPGVSVGLVIPIDVRMLLRPAARQRDISVDRLVLDIATAVAQAGTVDQVLGRGKP
jgi:hypothetical protein